MAPYEALYGCRCRSPICWDDLGERRFLGPDLVEKTEAKVRLIRQRLLTAQSWQKSYADRRRRDLEFQVGEHVLLRVSPSKGIKRFGLRSKLSLCFVGPFEILECVGPVAYRLALPPNLNRVHNVFHVSMLRNYLPDPSHVLDGSTIELRGGPLTDSGTEGQEVAQPGDSLR